ncbi:MAG: hypothetical protein PHI90_08520, partial [Clostridia bacterium]|nr:hypothetical protein [Clostridia bacterium]
EVARQRYYQRQKWLLDEESAIKYQQIQMERVIKQAKEEVEKGLREGKERLEKGLREGKEKVLREGEMKKATQVVKESLVAGLPVDIIATITKLSEEEILKIKKETEE